MKFRLYVFLAFALAMVSAFCFGQNPPFPPYPPGTDFNQGWVVSNTGFYTPGEFYGPLCNPNGPLDVKSCFGATGNGTTDDTIALQTAFSSLTAFSKRGLYFPPGNYIISSTLTAPVGLDSSVIFADSGYDGTGGPLNNASRTTLTWNGTNVSANITTFTFSGGILTLNGTNTFVAGEEVQLNVGNSDSLTPLNTLCFTVLSTGLSSSSFQVSLSSATTLSIPSSGSTSAIAVSRIPMVQFNQSSGIIWNGISLNANLVAGYGLQFMAPFSSTTGDSNNVIENLTISYTLADGIIMGQEGITPPGGQRQFFLNEYHNITYIGCAHAGLHINEQNADQQNITNNYARQDDHGSPQNTLYGFWFQNGGQQSLIEDSGTGGMTPVTNIKGSGYSIYNADSTISVGGAQGFTVNEFWQEGSGGIYYGLTGSDGTQKGYSFTNCNSFTSNTSNPSVFIDKGTSAVIPYTFTGCNFFSNLKVNNSTLIGNNLVLTNTQFASGFGIVDSSGNNINNGFETLGTISAGTVTISTFANVATLTLGSNISTLFANNNYANSQLTLMITQDATGGRTITWSGSGEFTNSSSIPQPATTPNSETTYTFLSNGTSFFLKSVEYSIPITGTGSPLITASLNSLTNSGNIGPTLLYAIPSVQGGTYRIFCYTVVTQAATTSSALPVCTIGYTDSDTNIVESLGITSAAAGNTVGTVGINTGGIWGMLTVNAKAGSNINYSTTGYASVGATSMQYAVHLKLEYLGQ